MSLPPSLILAVDNDEGILRMLVELLTEEGYRVVTAPDGAVALALLSRPDQEPPDLILLDTRMPVMSGLQFMQAYEQTTGQAPVLILSANSPAEDAAIEKTRIAGLLRKPFDIDELLALIEKNHPTPSTSPGRHQKTRGAQDHYFPTPEGRAGRVGRVSRSLKTLRTQHD